MRKILIVLGVPIDNLTMEEALDRIEEFIRIGRETGKTHQIATVNADFAVKATHDPELRFLLQESDMATADGMPLVWAAKLLRMPVPGRVTGADLVPALAERAARKGYTLYLLGAAPGVAVKAAEKLKADYPGLEIVGTLSPPYAPVIETDPSILEDIKEKKPDVLLVALGNPKQEKWIGMYGREIGVPVAIGIGATLDFLAGQSKRAPKWMQENGIEWMYRLAQEPGRLWKRYVNDLFGFMPFLARQWWLMRQGRGPTPIIPKSDLVILDDKALISLTGRLDHSNYAQINKLADEALAETADLTFDLKKTTFLDSSAIGALVGITKKARDAGGDTRLINVPPPVLNAIKLLKLNSFFDILEAEKETVSPTTKTPPATTPSSPLPAVDTKWTIIPVPRRFDATTAQNMMEKCAQVLAQNPHVVLDFDDTVFLASAGLAVMAQLNRQAKEKGGDVRLANCSEDVQRVIEMVRFDKIFTLFEDVRAATA